MARGSTWTSKSLPEYQNSNAVTYAQVIISLIQSSFWYIKTIYGISPPASTKSTSFTIESYVCCIRIYSDKDRRWPLDDSYCRGRICSRRRLETPDWIYRYIRSSEDGRKSGNGGHGIQFGVDKERKGPHRQGCSTVCERQRHGRKSGC